MNKFSSLKYSAVLLPVLALGMPMAHAGDPGQSATASDRSAAHHGIQRGFLDAVPDRGFHSDNLVGKDVMNRRNNETVGQVSDLVLDEDGQVVAVIISVGGLLGIGERDVAIEWDQIERRVDGDDVALSVDFPEDRLDNAPDYDSDRPDRSDRSDRSTGMIGTDRDRHDRGQRVGQRSDHHAGQRGEHDQREQYAQQRDQSDQFATERDNQRGTTGRMGQEYVENKPARGFHSDNLVGKEVKSRHDNESVGEISNLVIDNDGQVVAAVISVGGLLGIGARDVAISWDQIERRVEGDDVTLWVNLTEESLKDAPKYSTDGTASRRNR